MVYTLKQLQDILRAAGWDENLIVTMAAVGMGESSGNSSAVNPGIPVGREFSVGLWQINTKVHKTYTVEQLKNPAINAKEALRVYKSQGLKAWGAYSDGRYKEHLAASEAAYNGTISTFSTSPDNLQSTIGVGSLIIGAVILYLVFD